MKTIPLAVLALAFALPALAEDAKPMEGDIDVDFSWSSVALSSIPGAGGGSVVVSEAHLVLTGKAPFDKLAGRCLFTDVQAGESGKSTGACALADADGDMLFEDVTLEGDGGRGVLTGGTGKFAGMTGEHAVTLTWFSSIREGENQGVGTKTGHWKRQAM
jgi:hypothetical protein